MKKDIIFESVCRENHTHLLDIIELPFVNKKVKSGYLLLFFWMFMTGMSQDGPRRGSSSKTGASVFGARGNRDFGTRLSDFWTTVSRNQV